MGASREMFLKNPGEILLRFHPDRAHELPPLLDFGRAVGASLGGRGARLRVDADVRELLLELRVLRDSHERGMKAVDDVLRCSRSDEDRVPGPYVEPGQSALRQGGRSGGERRVL